MALNNKFKLMCENSIRRYQSCGFLAGDYIRLKPNALNHPALKDKAENFKKLIQSMQNSDLNLKICALKTDRPTNSTILGGADSPSDFWADIVTEVSPGGNFLSPVTLPIEVLVLQNEGGYYPPVPDSLKRKNPDNEVRQADQFQRTIDDSLKGEPLTRINVKISNSVEHDDSKPGGGAYIAKVKESATETKKDISNLYVEEVFNKLNTKKQETASLQTESIKKELPKLQEDSKTVTSDLSNVYEQFIFKGKK